VRHFGTASEPRDDKALLDNGHALVRVDEAEKPEGPEKQQHNGSNPHEIRHSRVVITVSRLDHSPKRQKSVGKTQYRSRRKRLSELEISRTSRHRRYPRAGRVRL
jgi:hypothetical protein